ncbi:MAG: hypothetical protein GX453_06725, partial [Lactococcus chungangensis]|nr:hypothetical protein [Lactococcus chungangensis]
NKIPYQIIVGDKEQADKSVNVRRYGSKETAEFSLTDFVAAITADVANYSKVVASND